MVLCSEFQADMWSCAEGPELNSSMNGEVLALLHIKGRVISSHSDGTIKVDLTIYFLAHTQKKIVYCIIS